MNITFTETSFLILIVVVSFWRSMSIVSSPILLLPRTISKTLWILVAAAGLSAPAGTIGSARRARKRAIVRMMITVFCGLSATLHRKSAGNETPSVFQHRTGRELEIRRVHRLRLVRRAERKQDKAETDGNLGMSDRFH